MHDWKEKLRPHKTYQADPNWRSQVPSAPPDHLRGAGGPAEIIKQMVLNTAVDNISFEYKGPDGDTTLKVHLVEVPFDLRYKGNLPISMYCLIEIEDTSDEARATPRNGGLGRRGKRHRVECYYVAPTGDLYPLLSESPGFTKTEAKWYAKNRLMEIKQGFSWEK